MQPINLCPALIVNGFALLAALPGAWMLHATRLREQRALEQLAERIENTPYDEPMPLLGQDFCLLTRSGYRIGTACLGFALTLSWASTWL